MGLKSTLQCFSSWWFQPIWKICSSNWIIPPSRGKNKKFLSCHHLVFEDLKKKRVLFVHFSTKPPPSASLQGQGGVGIHHNAQLRFHHTVDTIPDDGHLGRFAGGNHHGWKTFNKWGEQNMEVHEATNLENKNWSCSFHFCWEVWMRGSDLEITSSFTQQKLRLFGY